MRFQFVLTTCKAVCGTKKLEQIDWSVRVRGAGAEASHGSQFCVGEENSGQKKCLCHVSRLAKTNRRRPRTLETSCQLNSKIVFGGEWKRWRGEAQCPWISALEGLALDTSSFFFKRNYVYVHVSHWHRMAFHLLDGNENRDGTVWRSIRRCYLRTNSLSPCPPPPPRPPPGVNK